MKARLERKPGLPILGIALLGVAIILLALIGLSSSDGRSELTVQPPAQVENQPGDLVALNGDLEIGEGEVVEQDAKALNGDITLAENSQVLRDVIAWDGDIEVNGTVGGDITAFNGDIEINDGAVVEGDVNAPNGDVDVSDEALVSGRVFANERASSGGGLAGLIAGVIVALLLSVFFIAGGTMLVMSWPRRLQMATSTLNKSFGSAMAVGFLTALLLPFLVGAITFVLAITLVGILLIPVLWLAALALWFYGAVTVGLWLGQRMAESGGIPAARNSLLLTAVIGLGTLAVGGILVTALLPPLGWPGLYLLGYVGAGAGILSRFGSPTEWSKMPQVIATNAGRVTRRLTGQPPVPPDQRKAS